MKNSTLTRLNGTYTSTMLVISLLLISTLLSTSSGVLGIEPVTGAVWTTDPHGERVNGNLYTNAKNVYLAGGPHKKGAAGLPDGIYYFQVTDPAGKTLLSSDPISKRRFEVQNGYISSIDGGAHNYNPDTTRGYGIVVQLWPFTYTPNKGGVYKVWVTMVESYAPGQGCFGFIPSLSKTDNFKVKLQEVTKYFELWVTDGISGSPIVSFYVNYTVDGDRNATTFDPVQPWITGQLIYDRREGVYDVFRYETTFPQSSYIYWQFFISNSLTWISDLHGPELINSAGMVNKETLFKITGHKYDYLDNRGLEGWTITLYKDGIKFAETQTSPGGHYEFIALDPGNYKVCETNKTDEGWAPYGPTCYEFAAGTGDQTFDFYNYKMLQVTDTSDFRTALSTFDLVFTPSNDGSGMYKFSSTNPGSFYYDVVKYGTPNTLLRLEISLPPDQENAQYDSPNFILHHTYIGSTSVVDLHVYGGRVTTPGGEWIPDWSNDITNQFSITTSSDGKSAVVEGFMPDTGVVFVAAHIDYQISASLTLDQVQSFNDFNYTFSVQVYASVFGITMKFPVANVKK